MIYTGVPLLKDTLYRGHPSTKDTKSWQQVLRMHIMLPKDTFLLRTELFDSAHVEGVSLLEGGYCTPYYSTIITRYQLSL